MLQETKLKDDDANDDLQYRWRQVSEGEAYTSPAASSQSGGVAVLLSAHACAILSDRTQIPIEGHPHRHLLLQASLNNQLIYIHSIYAPVHRADRPSFFNQLTISSQTGSHLLGGDFNCVMDTELDTTGNHDIASAGSLELSGWLANFGAVDMWRLHNEDRKEFTSPSGSSRIDMIFASGCFTNHRSAFHARRTIGSDHLCPTLITSSCELLQSNGHWQLPTWLAKTASQNISATLEKLAAAADRSDYSSLFDRAMKEVTGKCQAAHKRVLRWRKNKLDRAHLRWLRAHTRATQFPTNELITDAENARQAWMKEISNKERMNRARAFDKHFADAERCSAFFLRRPKPARTTIIPGVKRSDGSVSNNHSDITDAHSNFWSQLYSANSGGTESAPSTINTDALTQIPLPKLSTEHVTLLEQEVSEDDIVEHITRLPNNKASGADGLKAELLKCAPKLWARVLKPIFERSLHEEEQLPPSLRDSIIVLIYKKGCNLDPRNYRPIALLSVLAKLLSAIHNSRLRRILTSVVPPEQTGFVPHRSISENITLLQDAIYYSKRNHPSSIILSLDFQKAYDRVQWSVLKAILRKLGFGPRWLTIISAMYKSRKAMLCINGDLSPPFDIQRGVLQGDPLSPALFTLQCMPLYAKLNAARHRHGIPFPHGPPAPVATFYADDTNLIAKSPHSAVCLYNIAEWFCNHFGEKLHPEKCVAISAGPAPPTLSNGIKILDPHRHVTILGVAMGTNISRQQQTENVFTKMLQRCNGWAHVGRTIEGRITIARSMLLSTLWFVLGVLPTNKKEAMKIQRVINNFIHGATDVGLDDQAVRANINSAWFYRNKTHGGWGLTPILHTLRVRKLAIIKNFLSDKAKNITKPWHAFITHMLEEHLSSWGKSWADILLWQTEDAEGQLILGNWNALTPWWRDAWAEWLKLECRPLKSSIPRTHLRKWLVWHNRILRSDHGLQSTLHRSFSNSTTRAIMSTIRSQGFLSFEDFMTNNGAVMSADELYSTVTVHLSVNNIDTIVPLWACRKLINIITALWTITLRNWLLQSSATPNAYITS